MGKPNKGDAPSLEEGAPAPELFRLTVEMESPIVNVATGTTGSIVMVDIRKIPNNVMAELVRQGIIKPLTDISKKEEDTPAQWHDRRLKRRDNWYNGDYTVRGGGTPDRIGVQMKLEIEAAFKERGVLGKALKEATKGSAKEILERKYPDAAKRAAADAHFRAKAIAELQRLDEAAAKLEVKAEDVELF